MEQYPEENKSEPGALGCLCVERRFGNLNMFGCFLLSLEVGMQKCRRYQRPSPVRAG